MFKRILVPLDGSQRAEYALPMAAHLARATHGSLILLTVMRADTEVAPFSQDARITQEIRDLATTHVVEYLAKVAHSKEPEGIETKIAISNGSPASIILESAESQHADLIVMATHGTTGFKRWMVGSVAQQVTRQSPVPVLALRDGGTFPASAYPDTSRPLHTVTAVVALDGEKMAEEAIGPAAHLVSALAALAPGIVHLARVVQLPATGDTHVEHRRRAREEAINEAEDDLRCAADDLREQLEKRYCLAVTWSVSVDTTIPLALIACAEQGRATRGAPVFGGSDILAITTQGRRGLPRMRLGSLSETILGATKLPLLIVPPRQDEGSDEHAQDNEGEEVLQ